MDIYGGEHSLIVPSLDGVQDPYRAAAEIVVWIARIERLKRTGLCPHPLPHPWAPTPEEVEEWEQEGIVTTTRWEVKHG